MGLHAQGGTGPLDAIGQGFGIKVAAAPRQAAGQQLVGAPASGRVPAAAAWNGQAGRQDRRSGSVQDPQGQAPFQAAVVLGGGGRGEAHAATASSRQARSGSSRSSICSWSRPGDHRSSSARGWSRGWVRPQRWLLPIRDATPPGDSREKR
jgi:hypothetical protein